MYQNMGRWILGNKVSQRFSLFGRIFGYIVPDGLAWPFPPPPTGFSNLERRVKRDCCLAGARVTKVMQLSDHLLHVTSHKRQCHEIFDLIRFEKNEDEVFKYLNFRGSQRDVVYLGWPISPSYMGGDGVVGSQPIEYSCAHGAQKNFRDLT